MKSRATTAIFRVILVAASAALLATGAAVSQDRPQSPRRSVAASPRRLAPRFASDVVPVLTRLGCNQGACHGAAQGKGGFRLSLLGYDPDLDYDSIVHAAAGRRVCPSRPEMSLLLRKPTLAVQHRGGLRLRVGSLEYRLLGDWIASGMPAPSPMEPRVDGLEVTPQTRTLGPGQSQRFRVVARLSDGSRRDVTDQALFSAGDEAVATVTPEGIATGRGPGEGPVIVRYRGLVAVARVVSPFGVLSHRTEDGRRVTDPSVLRPPSSVVHLSPVDRLIDAKLAALGLKASGPASDSDFLRRASLDAIGLLPTPDEVRAFLADQDPCKREKLIDRLLDRPEYVEFWTLKWSDLLRANRQLLSDKGMAALSAWIRESVAANKPWDQLAREVLLARGSPYEVGPANYYRAARTPQELAETTSQVFLGVRIECARCHNHPYERWTQNQYYQMAAFFARIREVKGPGQNEREVLVTNHGDVKHPKTQQVVAPCALDAAPLPAGYEGDRRSALAGWLTAPDNPFFARSIANRLWKHFMGRGLVEPVDDMRATNPPTNAPLLDWLAKDLVDHHFDLKHLMRTIMLSRAYQRTAIPTAANARDNRYCSHYPFKRLSAEQLLDAVTRATGVPEKFPGYPAGTRAAELQDATVPSYFLDLFGRPARTSPCECERTDDPNLGQVIHLMNSAGINGRLSDKNGRLAKLLDAHTSDTRLVEELFLATVSRYPTPAESRRAIAALWGRERATPGSGLTTHDLRLTTPDRQRQAAEDLLWALLNSKEFLFNH